MALPQHERQRLADLAAADQADEAPHAPGSRSIARDRMLSTFYNTETIPPTAPARDTERWTVDSIAKRDLGDFSQAHAPRPHGVSIARAYALERVHGTHTTDDPALASEANRRAFNGYARESIAARPFAGSESERAADRARRAALVPAPVPSPFPPQPAVAHAPGSRSVARDKMLSQFYGTDPWRGSDAEAASAVPERSWQTDSIASQPAPTLSAAESQVGSARKTMRTAFYHTHTLDPAATPERPGYLGPSMRLRDSPARDTMRLQYYGTNPLR